MEKTVKTTKIRSKRSVKSKKACTCTVRRRRVCGELDCISSFAVSKRAPYWSKKNVLKPHEVSLSCGFAFIFDCDNCPHEFPMHPNHIASQNRWCMYCTNQMLCPDRKCKICYDKSFASVKDSKYWHPTANNGLMPIDEFKTSAHLATFQCNKCPHAFKTKIYVVTYGSWCFYCAPNSVDFCDNVGCEFCLKKSCFYEPISKVWSENNTLLPTEVTKGSDTNKINIICLLCYDEFPITPSNYNGGKRCPLCRLKTEKKLRDFLLVEIVKGVKRGFYAKWCVNPETGRILPFDFLLALLRLIIEVDGDQHFEDIEFFNSSAQENHDRDMLKMGFAIENKYSIVRIMQTDIYYDRNNWQKRLLSHLHKYKKPTVVLMDSHGEYTQMRTALAKLDEPPKIVYDHRTYQKGGKSHTMPTSKKLPDKPKIMAEQQLVPTNAPEIIKRSCRSTVRMNAKGDDVIGIRTARARPIEEMLQLSRDRVKIQAAKVTAKKLQAKAAALEKKQAKPKIKSTGAKKHKSNSVKGKQQPTSKRQVSDSESDSESKTKIIKKRKPISHSSNT